MQLQTPVQFILHVDPYFHSVPFSSLCASLLPGFFPLIPGALTSSQPLFLQSESAKLYLGCLSLHSSIEALQSQEAVAVLGLTSFLSLRDASSLLPSLKIVISYTDDLLFSTCFKWEGDFGLCYSILVGSRSSYQQLINNCFYCFWCWCETSTR